MLRGKNYERPGLLRVPDRRQNGAEDGSSVCTFFVPSKPPLSHLQFVDEFLKARPVLNAWAVLAGRERSQ
jgi:hypothetical protein